MIEPCGRSDEKEGLSNAHAYRLRDRRRCRSCCTQRHSIARGNAPATRQRCGTVAVAARAVGCRAGNRLREARRAGISMQIAMNWLCWPFLLAMLGICTAAAQEKGKLHPQPLPAIQDPENPSTPEKEFFARKLTPAALKPAAIGFYSNGCLAGAVPLPIDGPHWQVMRVSRNRYWGHPDLISSLQTIARKASDIGWPGLLVGDIAQPRGGPMLTGHSSHQIGLDADIWFRPMPRRALTALEREEMMSTVVVAADRRNVAPKIWTPSMRICSRWRRKSPGWNASL